VPRFLSIGRLIAFAQPPQDALSPRVREAIARTEDRNEVLLGWVQAAVVSLLGALYLVSPKGFKPNDVAFEPIPWVLAGYAPLVVARLVLAHRRRLAPWIVTSSIFVDVGVLFVLIWSFHIQYCQPAAFYLKAPTFAYAFLFIALRSLRYDARYVVLAGAASIAGWTALVGWALGPGDAEITRSFVEYSMGYYVLVGAELDKVVSIAMVTGVLAVGTTRSRRLLADAAREGQARRELTRFFSPDVAARIVTSADAIRPGEGEMREATALMIDLRGFTRLASTLPPDRVMQLLGDFQRRMVAVLFAHGGSIDKFLGDGILAHFGAATPSATHAADALRAVDDVVAAAREWSAAAAAGGVPGLDVGAACASGELLFGAVGDGDRLEYTIIGNPVNLAAKLEKHTKSEGVRALCDAATWTLAAASGYEAPANRRVLRARPVAGVAEPIDLVVLAERSLFGTDELAA
jgi:adenylate cyclase